MPYKKVTEFIEWTSLNLASGIYVSKYWGIIMDGFSLQGLISGIVGISIVVFNFVRAIKLWHDYKSQREDREYIAGQVKRLHEKRGNEKSDKKHA